MDQLAEAEMSDEQKHAFSLYTRKRKGLDTERFALTKAVCSK